VLYDDNRADSVPNIEKFDFGDGDNPADGTGGQVIVDRLARAGVASHIDQRPAIQVLVDARSNGMNRVFVAVWSDHAGTPIPMTRSMVIGGGTPIGHWVLWGGNHDYMQPVGGTIQQYDDPTIEVAAQNYCVVVDQAIGVYEMTPDKEESLDQECAWKTHESVLGRIPNDKEFAWALGESRKSHIAFLWEVIGGAEFSTGGGLLGAFARQQAELNALKAELESLKAGITATVDSAGEAAQNAHIAAVQAQMAAIAKAAS
jgi:hypothetical protein